MLRVSPARRPWFAAMVGRQSAPCSWLGSAALARALLGAFAGLLEPVGLALDGDDLGVVHEAVDQRNDAGSVGENVAPLGKGAVGGDQRALGLVAARDQLEHQVGMAVGVGQVADLVDHQQLRPGVVAQAAAQGRVAVERAEVAEQLAGAGEQHGVAVDQRLMGDVLRQRRLADAVRADQDDVGETEAVPGLLDARIWTRTDEFIAAPARARALEDKRASAGWTVRSWSAGQGRCLARHATTGGRVFKSSRMFSRCARAKSAISAVAAFNPRNGSTCSIASFISSIRLAGG